MVDQIREMILDPKVIKVLDFDHTIANTSSFHQPSFKGALADLGGKVEITPEVAAAAKGKSDEEIFELLIALSNKSATIEIASAIRAREEYLERSVQDRQDHSQLLMPGVDVLVKLMTHEGIRAGIASASPDNFVRIFLERAKVNGVSLGTIFPADAIVGGTTIRACSNPPLPPLYKPDIYSVLASARRISSEGSILYIGDGEIDAKTAGGMSDITGVIVNPNCQSLEAKFGSYPNLVFVKSLQEVLV